MAFWWLGAGTKASRCLKLFQQIVEDRNCDDDFATIYQSVRIFSTSLAR
jgi:hypothetical protein